MSYELIQVRVEGEKVGVITLNRPKALNALNGPLMDELGADFAIVTPAFPENGRTVFKGHLFVGDLLLSDSPMRHHPLTPMTDANLVRVITKRAVLKLK